MKTTFDYVLSADQIAHAMRYNGRRSIEHIPRRWLLRLVGFLVWIAMAVNSFFAFSAHAHGQSYAPMISLTVMILSAVCYLVLQSQGLQQLYRLDHHLIEMPCQVGIEATGLRYSSTHWQSFMNWSAFSRIEETGDLLLLALDNLHNVVIPTTVFESPEEKRAFVAYVREKIAAA